MKKTIFMAIAAMAITFAGCGNKTAAPVGTADSDSIIAFSEESQTTSDYLTTELQKALKANNSERTIASLATLQAIYKNLVDNGKLNEALSYGAAIKNFINENAEAIKKVASGNTTIANLVEGIKKLPTTATTTTEEAKNAVAADVVNLVSPAVAKGATAIASAAASAEAVKNAPAAVKEAAATAASKAVEEAKTATENKVNEKVTEAQTKANDAVNKAAEKTKEKVDKAKERALRDLGL